MATNILTAIAHLVENPNTQLHQHNKSKTRANAMGDSLEEYIKDLFANSLNENDVVKKNEIYNQKFCYFGNQNNPPDFIIKNGDAVEVKKIETMESSLALNSSYPKDKLYSTSNMITDACRTCEPWSIKDLLYAIGTVKDGNLKALWMVYGDCYAADRSVYERIQTVISDGVNGIEDIQFSPSKELGRVNKVDPLGITYMRIRGMWGIENPNKVFNYIVNIDKNARISVNSIMLKSKYDSFSTLDKAKIASLANKGLGIKDIRIKSPNNPANLLDAKLISFRM